MKLFELNLMPKGGQKVHPEISYPSMYDNTTNWGVTKRVKTKDVVVRDSKTKTIYGRRAIVQRES